MIIDDIAALRILLDIWLDIAAERFTREQDQYFKGQYDAFGLVLDALDTICPVEVHTKMATQPPSNSNSKPGATTVKPEASNQRKAGAKEVRMPVNRSCRIA